MRLPYNFLPESSFERRCFENPHCCRSDSYNSPCFVDFVCGFLRNGETLHMHSMLGDVIRAHWEKCSRCYMQRHERVRNLMQDLGGEMQTSRRRSHGARFTSKNGLVTSRVRFIARPIDIWG